MTINMLDLYNKYQRSLLDYSMFQVVNDEVEEFTYNDPWPNDVRRSVFDDFLYNSRDERSISDYADEDWCAYEVTVMCFGILLGIVSLMENAELNLKEYVERPISSVWPYIAAANCILPDLTESVHDAISLNVIQSMQKMGFDD